MRIRLPVTALLLAVATITCSDASTGPVAPPSGPNAATVTLAPAFSPDAARAYVALKGSDMGVRTTYLRLSGQGVATRDTVVALTAGQELETVDLHVLIPGTTQTYSAFVELPPSTARHCSRVRRT